MIIYSAALLISFLGLIVGIILTLITIEELKHVSKYTKILTVILPAIASFVGVYKMNFLYSIIVFIAVLAIAWFIKKDAIIFSIMPVVIYLAYINDELLNVTTIIFIYAIALATNEMASGKSHKLRPMILTVVKHNAYFLLTGAIIIAWNILYSNI